MSKTTKGTLLFVYNADGSLLAEIKGVVHKMVSPNTYECQLCKITYDAVTPKKDWKEFLKALPYKTEFLHRDEFKKQYKDLQDLNLPAIFKVREDKPVPLIQSDELSKLTTVEDLINRLKERLNL